MSHFRQTSSRNADKILNGAHAFLNKFNQNKPEDKKYTFNDLIQEFDTCGELERKNIAKALWLSGTPSIVTNSPYPAGMSETILENRANERDYLNNLNICLKETIVNDLGEPETESNIVSKIKVTLVALDQLSISSQKREKMFDSFHNSFISIDDKNNDLDKLFEKGIKEYNEFTLTQTLAKFSIDAGLDEPTQNQEDPKDLTF